MHDGICIQTSMFTHGGDDDDDKGTLRTTWKLWWAFKNLGKRIQFTCIFDTIMKPIIFHPNKQCCQISFTFSRSFSLWYILECVCSSPLWKLNCFRSFFLVYVPNADLIHLSLSLSLHRRSAVEIK
jgi:hypothetical protein